VLLPRARLGCDELVDHAVNVVTDDVRTVDGFIALTIIITIINFMSPAAT